MCEIVTELGETIGRKEACQQLGVPRCWYYRHTKAEFEPLPLIAEVVEDKGKKVMPHQLSEQERAEVRDILNSPRFQDKSPRQVYATLLDEGRYYCHWRTMYRVLAEQEEVKERRRQSQHATRVKPELVARQPNQVWSWDITWLPTLVKGRFFYLYLILDMYSRYVVGWLIATTESSDLAEQFIAQTCHRHQIPMAQLTLHADRGAPMRSKAVTALLQDLNVTQSHSRPRTSNDNAYSEAQFKTLKYRPDYPGQFGTLEEARAWVSRFVNWYNQEHYHSGLSLLTPQMVHQGESQVVCQQRQQVLSAAYAIHPERFKNGRPVVKAEPATVWLNRPVEPNQAPMATESNRV
jgi:putative transposase